MAPGLFRVRPTNWRTDRLGHREATLPKNAEFVEDWQRWRIGGFFNRPAEGRQGGQLSAEKNKTIHIFIFSYFLFNIYNSIRYMINKMFFYLIKFLVGYPWMSSSCFHSTTRHAPIIWSTLLNPSNAGGEINQKPKIRLFIKQIPALKSVYVLYMYLYLIVNTWC